MSEYKENKKLSFENGSTNLEYQENTCLMLNFGSYSTEVEFEVSQFGFELKYSDRWNSFEESGIWSEFHASVKRFFEFMENRK
jgi:hypothetical protein